MTSVPFSHDDTPIRSHCIVVSLTTETPRAGWDVAAWIRNSMMNSGKVLHVMVGPAGRMANGEREAYALACIAAQLQEDQVPASMRPLRAAFIEATKESPRA